MQRLLSGAGVALALALVVSTSSPARACTDGGAGNDCNDGGPAWIACATHADCPAGQQCNWTGWCTCGTGCGGDRCTRPQPPDAGPSCAVFETACGMDVFFDVRCDAGPPEPVVPRCTTDAGADGPAPVSCTTDVDCEGLNGGIGFPLVCAPSGVCDCPEEAGRDGGVGGGMDGGDEPAPTASCSAAAGSRGSWWALALALAPIALRSRARRLRGMARRKGGRERIRRTILP